MQYELIKDMGIARLHAVMGPSAGGMIAQQWAVHYPHMVERMIGVITNPQNPIITSVNVAQNAMRLSGWIQVGRAENMVKSSQ